MTAYCSVSQDAPPQGLSQTHAPEVQAPFSEPEGRTACRQPCQDEQWYLCMVEAEASRRGRLAALSLTVKRGLAGGATVPPRPCRCKREEGYPAVGANHRN